MSALPGYPTREAIAADLTTVARQGLKVRRLHLKLGSLGALGELECVRSRPTEHRAEAIRDVVAEAVEGLPSDGSREALQALLGIGATAEMPHASRRSAEMQALGLDPTVTSEHSFRKTREKELLWDLAGAIVDIAWRRRRGEVAAGVPASEPRPADDDRSLPSPPVGTGVSRRGRARALVSALAFYVVTGLLVAGLALLAWQGTRSPRPVDDLVVTSPLRIDPPTPRVGQPVTASFTVGRRGTGPEGDVAIAAGGRADPTRNACQRSDPMLAWNAPGANFPVADIRKLTPGKRFAYRAVRTFDQPGWYFAEPVKETAEGTWGGIPFANRVCFQVQ